MKEAELKLVSELMKNSRRSDRALARAVGVSQPTISRMIAKLEREGVIREYTIIPDFQKLGFELMVLTFVKLKKGLVGKELDEARKLAREKLHMGPREIIMLERGMGLKHDGVIISFHKNYSEFQNFTNWMTQFSFLSQPEISSFIISLADKVKYRPFTFATLAEHILPLEKPRRRAKRLKSVK